ncbi:MAG: acyl-CoA dehydrogenase [Chloroflexi bacterium]|nr:MAG: acyl-CoA dehydrogenase [Chloroflexota bacterium]
MDFSLSDEQRMILGTVREFVHKELLPLEADIQRAELEGRHFPDRSTLRQLQGTARKAGLWGLLTPEEYGGANLGFLMTALITMETARALVPFTYGGSGDNILYQCTPAQRERYLLPTIEGERQSCFALTEPDTGSDATNIKMPAVREGDEWVLNGQKVFITNGCEADFAIVFAVTDRSKGHKGGVTAFLVDRAMGWSSRRIETMGSWGPAELHFDNVRVPDENVLGEVGEGVKLAMVEEVGWLVLSAAWRADQSGDARHAISMAKLAGAEMIWRVADRVLQIHGGTGYTKELPIERVMRDVRVYRIYEGTDEIQRRSIARNLLERNARIGSWA